jgi:hypothetical protein
VQQILLIRLSSSKEVLPDKVITQKGSSEAEERKGKVIWYEYVHDLLSSTTDGDRPDAN